MHCVLVGLLSAVSVFHVNEVTIIADMKSYYRRVRAYYIKNLTVISATGNLCKTNISKIHVQHYMFTKPNKLTTVEIHGEVLVRYCLIE